jgi:hypothetical protein
MSEEGSGPLVTAEVRWFGQGEVPSSVLSWFELDLPAPIDTDGDGIDEEEGRTDRYLLSPGVDSVSVKLRGGSGFEVKRREGGYSVFSVGGLSGNLGVWKKWELPGPHGTTGPLVEDESGDWLDVLKHRRMRSYGVFGRDVRAMPDPRNDRPDGGCSVELSALTRGGRGGEAWWTVCFEALGADPVAMLERVVPFVLGEAAPPVLDADHTQDYPAWLVEPAGRHRSR